VAEWGEEVFAQWWRFACNPLNGLTFGIFAHGMLKSFSPWIPFSGKSSQHKYLKKAEETIMKGLGPRLNVPDSELGNNVLDCVVKEIRRRERDGLEPYIPQHYVSDIIGVSWAGIDTSHANISGFFGEMAKDHTIQNEFLDNINGWFADSKTK